MWEGEIGAGLGREVYVGSTGPGARDLDVPTVRKAGGHSSCYAAKFVCAPCGCYLEALARGTFLDARIRSSTLVST